MQDVDNTSQTSQQDQTQPSTPILPWQRATSGWIALLGALGFGVIYMALPAKFTIGPSWILLVIELVLILPIGLSWLIQHPIPHRLSRILMFTLLTMITGALITGVVILVSTLPRQSTPAATGLLRTGGLLWISNILVFALWYWEIDGGGPRARHMNGNKGVDFLFPQQADGNTQGWVPNFIDYLFVAFTGATALSPTDTYPLTRPAKGLMMIEAIIALIVLAILVGRAINIL
jgi:hypothetical protein